MFAIGDSVLNPDFGPGFVVGIAGAPGGSTSYRVARPEKGMPYAMDFRAEEIEPGPPLPEYEPGQTVHVHAGEGVVIARLDGNKYVVDVMRVRHSGLVLEHVYLAVAPHEIALSEGASTC